jgi:uncharacterized membrane protein (UPF0136 family)
MRRLFGPSGILSAGLLAGAVFGLWLRGIQWLFHIDVEEGQTAGLSIAFVSCVMLAAVGYRVWLESEKREP